MACRGGHDSIVQLLIKNGADVNLCDSKEFSPLTIASKLGHQSNVQMLLENGADVNLFEEMRL